mgnify:CR=1 FL=1
MKLIDIAICIDNLDPKHMGRIRCVRYSSYTGEQEKAVGYNPWDDKDLFTVTCDSYPMGTTVTFTT